MEPEHTAATEPQQQATTEPERKAETEPEYKAETKPEHHHVSWQSSLTVCPLAPQDMPPGYFTGKAAILNGLSQSYESQMQPFETPRVFGAIHLAAFSILGPEAIDTVSHDQAKLRAVGDTIQSVANYFVTGSIPKQAAGAADSESAEAVTSKATDPEPAVSQEPAGSNARENIASRTFRFMRGRLHRSSVPQKRARDDTLTGADNEAPGPAARRPSTRPRDRNKTVAIKTKKRDGLQCIFTHARVAVDGAHILPHAINAAEDHVSFFSMIVPHLTTMFGGTFANRLTELVGSRGASDQMWNMLTLEPYLHRLFDMGLIGFRPERITKTILEEGGEVFHVQFGIHWLLRTELQCCHVVVPTDETLRMMQTVRPEYQLNKKKFGAHNKESDARIPDGTLVSIQQVSLEDAQKMYDCLGMSWAMRMILFLAGAAGIPDGDPRSDDEFHDSAETNGFWDEFENHQAILDECFGPPVGGIRRPSF